MNKQQALEFLKEQKECRLIGLDEEYPSDFGSDTTHQHDWNIIVKKHDNIKRAHSSDSETHITSKCECGATKIEYNKTLIQEVPQWEDTR